MIAIFSRSSRLLRCAAVAVIAASIGLSAAPSVHAASAAPSGLSVTTASLLTSHDAGMMTSCDPSNVALTERITSINGGTAVEATFQNNNASTCSPQKVGLASYQRHAGDTADTNGTTYHQTLFKSAMADLQPNHSITLRVDIPSCSYQADAFYGDVIVNLSYPNSLYGNRKLNYTFGNKTISCDATPTNTPVPPTNTPVPPTNTSVPPTATVAATDVPTVTPPGTNTPELGSGELIAAGLLPIAAILLYRRRRNRRA